MVLVLKLPFYLGLIIAFFGVMILKFQLIKLHEIFLKFFENDKSIKVWIVSREPNRLMIEKSVFEYNEFQITTSSSTSKSWDVLWSAEYPFRYYREQIRNLLPHQRVNHIPGMTHLTIKKHLATKFNYDFIPKGFTFPNMNNDFQKYTKEHPDVKFVEKNWYNRGVKLVQNINEINLKSFSTAAATKEKFLQVFVERPYLINNKMFDIGIYVLVTFDPLRVYKFDKEILLRFCSQDYYPFNGDNTKQYVVDDDSLYVWDIPSLRDYVLKFNYTSKASFEEHMRKNGHNIATIWEQTDDAIINLLLDSEKNVIKNSRMNENHAQNFFEILRFDFIIDENLKAHLMEINMSPNLATLKDYSNIKRNYRSQIIYDTINLLGIKDLKKHKHDYIISDVKDIIIPMSACSQQCACLNQSEQCELCASCMTENEFQKAHSFYREHVRRGRMTRIFPTFRHHYLIKKVSDINRFAIKWFTEKCKSSQEWC